MVTMTLPVVRKSSHECSVTCSNCLFYLSNREIMPNSDSFLPSGGSIHYGETLQLDPNGGKCRRRLPLDGGYPDVEANQWCEDFYDGKTVSVI